MYIDFGRLSQLKKQLEDPELKKKFDELEAYVESEMSEEDRLKQAKKEGFSSLVDRELYVLDIVGGIEYKYNEMLREKEKAKSYKKLIKRNYDILIKEGISQEKLDVIINKETRISLNMDNEIVEKLFVLETLKVFNKYDTTKSKISEITRIGGGFYYDGDILGYVVKMNDQQIYTIVLSERVKDTHGEILMFGETNDVTQLQKEKQMLSIFAMFSNANTISYQTKKVDSKILSKKL
jgi:hypothetical protein